MAGVADPYHFMRTFDLDLSELTSESYLALMGQRRAYNLTLGIHRFQGVPITMPEMNRFKEFACVKEPKITFTSSFGIQIITWLDSSEASKDVIVPNAPGAELVELQVKSTHGALSQEGTATTVGGIVLVQGFHELLRYQAQGQLTDAVLKAFHRCVLMFSEAERFRSARAHVCHTIDTYICETMPDTTSVRFTNWGTLSEAGLQARRQHQALPPNEIQNQAVPADIQQFHINNIQELKRGSS
ncbi:hypothetical protein EJB05_12515 [Eragrostis curvula]|uniref:rRNA N-glycosylase n=1 Tax=Eragrostis curvula TaxID=38414 RepID=A0A5J9VVK5_9POAL|nr:hypothetical protein EJB05_12515 [Eragrostis curvula]